MIRPHHAKFTVYGSYDDRPSLAITGSDALGWHRLHICYDDPLRCAYSSMSRLEPITLVLNLPFSDDDDDASPPVHERSNSNFRWIDMATGAVSREVTASRVMTVGGTFYEDRILVVTEPGDVEEWRVDRDAHTVVRQLKVHMTPKCAAGTDKYLMVAKRRGISSTMFLYDWATWSLLREIKVDWFFLGSLFPVTSYSVENSDGDCLDLETHRQHHSPEKEVFVLTAPFTDIVVTVTKPTQGTYVNGGADIVWHIPSPLLTVCVCRQVYSFLRRAWLGACLAAGKRSKQ